MSVGRPFRRHRMYPPRRPLALSLVFTFFAALPATAADAWPVARGPSHEPAPYRYDARAWKKVPRAFLEDAAACLLYAGTSHVVAADGTIETTSHDLTRLNGRKGIEKLGEYRGIVFTPGHQKLTLHLARVHKPDGRVLD